MSDLTRRDTLKLIAVASATASCLPDSKARTAASADRADSKETPMNAPAADAILATKPLGNPPWETPDPFLFCVHHDDAYPRGNEQQGPAATLDGRDMGQDFGRKDGWSMYHGMVVPGFPAHPHRGFETVTVVRQGHIDHSDSMGATARYGGGDVQWLTAGAGIQHAEMFPLNHRDKANPVELFQIWLNLPRAGKFVQPYFKMLWADTIPRHTVKDAAGKETLLTTYAGAYAAAGTKVAPPTPPPDSYAAKDVADVAIWTIKLAPGASFQMPAANAGTNRTLYYFHGSGLSIAGRAVAGKHLVKLRGDAAVELVNGAVESELLLLQGRPIGEPVVSYGPFVMNTREEIQQAFNDYRRTRFGGWPWDRDDPVHAATEGRFAKRPDGSVERPA